MGNEGDGGQVNDVVGANSANYPAQVIEARQVTMMDRLHTRKFFVEILVNEGVNLVASSAQLGRYVSTGEASAACNKSPRHLSRDRGRQPRIRN
jgi:hypothetical protein